mmetsp:Transcript_13292/g.35744  ORF Transcript_13292/g.35744 Transcript_13292/m.35744 type:complete len:81 (+) Transcript_13292:790-1032(+)
MFASRSAASEQQAYQARGREPKTKLSDAPRLVAGQIREIRTIKPVTDSVRFDQVMWRESCALSSEACGDFSKSNSRLLYL